MEIILNDKIFRIDDISTHKQFHLLRKLSPMLEPILESTKKENASEVDIITGFASVIASLSDDIADYCLYGLLDVVSIKESGGVAWSKICASNGKQLIYSNINILEMMQLAYKSFMHNFKDCFAFLTSDLAEIQKKN